MPEFIYTPLSDQDDIEDGLFLGHLDVMGKSGTATTRTTRRPDGGMGIILFPAVVDLLDGMTGLLRRGRGRFTSSGMGPPLTFKLNGQVMSIRRRLTVIDESSPQAVADAVWAAAQKLSNALLPRVTEATEYTETMEDGSIGYIDYRVQLPAAMSRFQEARKSLTYRTAP
ncbi:hypothetical protein EDD90_4760 [Streptomyces sp. Ag109_O5-1]|uniref:hypothetical protein n=1 Tax=Streptomyces sp. Ag109_O5-1 TaxID=1938851 RepID=UPI000F50ADC9|nr:hypothetical protein [Streptomyces sp. Ag109_O5-1]RPE41669.1 hypothetical protein EDD90_4760 [Streptomyces sp. Ag109_O5-1]